MQRRLQNRVRESAFLLIFRARVAARIESCRVKRLVYIPTSACCTENSNMVHAREDRRRRIVASNDDDAPLTTRRPAYFPARRRRSRLTSENQIDRSIIPRAAPSHFLAHSCRSRLWCGSRAIPQNAGWMIGAVTLSRGWRIEQENTNSDIAERSYVLLEI